MLPDSPKFVQWISIVEIYEGNFVLGMNSWGLSVVQAAKETSPLQLLYHTFNSTSWSRKVASLA